MRKVRKRLALWSMLMGCVAGLAVMGVSAVQGKGAAQAKKEGKRVEAKMDLINEGAFPEAYGEVIGGSPLVKAGALTDANREAVVKRIYEAILECRSDIDLSDFNIHSSEIKPLLESIVNEKPNLFYVDSRFSYQFEMSGTVMNLQVNYIQGKTEIAQQQARIADAIGLLLKDLDPSASEFEKALHVHDALALRCEYDSNYLLDQNRDMVLRSSFTMKGALVDGMAVCQGYSMAYRYILETYFGMECKIVTSEAMDHAWNLVKIGNSYYHVDVTHDDPVPDTLGYVGHENFLLSEQAARAAKSRYRGFNYEGMAVDRRYDYADWKEVDSAILKAGNDRFCIDGDGRICKFVISDGGDASVATMQVVRDADRDWWSCKLAVGGDTIYFNTQSGVFSMKSDNTRHSSLYTWTGLGDVYGLAWKDGVLQFATKMNVEDNGIKQPMDNIVEDVTRMRRYVTFDVRNGVDDPLVRVAAEGQAVALPSNPSRAGYKFAGWFTSMDGMGEAFTAATPVTSDIVVYAKWETGGRAFTVKKKSVRVGKGSSFSLRSLLSPKSALVEYKTNNKKVATVDAKGKVKAKAVGVCKVTILSKEDGASTSHVEIVVTPKKPSIGKGKASGGKVALKWKSAKGVTGWEVFRSTKQKKGYKKVAGLKGAKRTTYTDAKVNRGKEYFYRIRSYQTVKGKKIVSDYSKVVKKAVR